MEGNKKPKILTSFNTSLCLLLILYSLIFFAFLPWTKLSAQTWVFILLFDFIFLRLTNIMWHLAHESIHGALFPVRKFNNLMGKILGVFLLSSYTTLNIGHMIHHKTNRISDVTDLYFEKNKPNFFSYYFDILGGFYWLYCFLLCFLCFFPQKILSKITRLILKKNRDPRKKQLYMNAQNFIQNKKIMKKVRIETIIMCFYFLLCSYAFYKNNLINFWIGHLLIRSCLFSYLNNMPHYGNKLDEVSASDTSWLPKPLARIYLNFNYHKTHHDNPTAPWHILPRLFKEQKGSYNKNYILDYGSQLKGPIYYKKVE